MSVELCVTLFSPCPLTEHDIVDTQPDHSNADTHSRRCEGVDIHGWEFYNVKPMPSSGIYLFLCRAGSNEPRTIFNREVKAVGRYEDVVCEAKDGIAAMGTIPPDAHNIVCLQSCEVSQDLNNNYDVVERVSPVRGESADMSSLVDGRRKAAQSSALLALVLFVLRPTDYRRRRLLGAGDAVNAPETDIASPPYFMNSAHNEIGVEFENATLPRTARKIMDGTLLVPSSA